MEAFKGVVRNHGPFTSSGSRSGKTGPRVYRYVVMGMIVTDEPIEAFKTRKIKKDKLGESSTFVLGGATCGLLDSLAAIPQLEPKRDVRGYTADQILTGLNEIA